MIAGDHHHRHERDGLDALRLKLGDNVLKARPALDRIDERILELHLVDAILNYGIISVCRMRRAMRHDEDGFIVSNLGELRRKRLQSRFDVIALLFLPLPVDERRAERHLLEVALVLIEDRLVIGIFHARNDIERAQRNARIAVLLELLQRRLRCRNIETFLRLDAVYDDMRSKCQLNLHVRMSRLNRLDRRLNRLLTRILEGRAKAHDEDGVLVREILHLGIVVLQDADFRCLKESRCRILDFGIQHVGSIGGRCAQSENSTARERHGQHFLEILLHSISLL